MDSKESVTQTILEWRPRPSYYGPGKERFEAAFGPAFFGPADEKEKAVVAWQPDGWWISVPSPVGISGMCRTKKQAFEAADRVIAEREASLATVVDAPGIAEAVKRGWVLRRVADGWVLMAHPAVPDTAPGGFCAIPVHRLSAGDVPWLVAELGRQGLVDALEAEPRHDT